jgi:hypothetical protein
VKPRWLFFFMLKIKLRFPWLLQFEKWLIGRQCRLLGHSYTIHAILTNHTAIGPPSGGLLICDRCNAFKPVEPCLVKAWFRDPATP